MFSTTTRTIISKTKEYVNPKYMSTYNNNPLARTDAYKLGHMEQYVPGCNKVYSHLIARSNATWDHSIFFGLQYYLKEYLSKPITREHVAEFVKVRNSVLGSTPQNVIDKYNSLADKGYWPIEIKAVPEGTVIGNKNVLMTIVNTDPDFHWTVGYVESLLLKLWYSSSVATTSYSYKKIVDKYFDKTVSKENFALKPFMVHDFGYRGDASEEGAMLSGIGHLTSFIGSDTLTAYNGAKTYYNATTPPLMLSVPASEHSVMCSFGKDGELDAYKNMLKLYPSGIVSIVSDTYDIWNVLTNFATILKDDILNRDGKVVFRPDSGDPELIICGDPNADPQSPEGKGCIRLLDELFGSTVNEKGYRDLNPKIGLIYGDGMYLERYERTLARLEQMGYSTSNLVIGVGGILRNHTRDTLGYAIKATKVEVNGIEKSIMKDPITDQGKKSFTGYLKLDKVNDKYVTYENVTADEEKEGLLLPVFKDGEILREYSIEEIRKNINGETR
jgi:nicotinamide phosphoribosyltransferase